MKIYRRSPWNLIKGIMLTPLAVAVVYAAIYFLLQYVELDLGVYAVYVRYGVPAIVGICMLFLTLIGESISFRLTRDGILEYRTLWMTRASYEVETVDFEFHYRSLVTGNTGHNDIALEVRYEDGSKEMLDCAPLGRKKAEQMLWDIKDKQLELDEIRELEAEETAKHEEILAAQAAEEKARAAELFRQEVQLLAPPMPPMPLAAADFTPGQPPQEDAPLFEAAAEEEKPAPAGANENVSLPAAMAPPAEMLEPEPEPVKTAEPVEEPAPVEEPEVMPTEPVEAIAEPAIVPDSEPASAPIVEPEPEPIAIPEPALEPEPEAVTDLQPSGPIETGLETQFDLPAEPAPENPIEPEMEIPTPVVVQEPSFEETPLPFSSVQTPADIRPDTADREGAADDFAFEHTADTLQESALAEDPLMQSNIAAQEIIASVMAQLQATNTDDSFLNAQAEPEPVAMTEYQSDDVNTTGPADAQIDAVALVEELIRTLKNNSPSTSAQRDPDFGAPPLEPQQMQYADADDTDESDDTLPKWQGKRLS